MKVIIAGSRGITCLSSVIEAINESNFLITQVVSGKARGVDELGEEYADRLGIPVKEFPADWKLRGKYAGYYRNKQMGDYADALIAVWDGKSRGTKQMIDYMKGKNKPTYVKVISE